MKCEANGGIDQHNALESRQNIIQLRSIGLKELTTGGNVEEQVAYRETAAHGTRTHILALYFGAREYQAGTYLISLAARAQLHLRHRCNRR